MRRPLALAGAALLATGLLAGCTSGTSHTTSSAPGTSSAPATGATSAPAAPSARPHRPRLEVRRLGWRLPQPIAREALVPDGTSGVVLAGGLLPGNGSSAATYRLDLATGRATPLHDLPVEVHDTAGALVGGHDLVIGGGNASEQAVVQSRTGRRWHVVGRLPGARSDLVAAAAGGTTYVIGGYDGTSPALAAVLATRDGRHWTTAARLPVPVRYPATVVRDGALWVFGGERNGAMVDDVQRVDLASGRAKVVAHLPGPLGHEVAISLGSRVLVAGGRTTSDRLTSRMWWFDPSGGRFHRAGRLPRPLADASVVTSGGSTYVVGGETPGLSDRVLRVSLH